MADICKDLNLNAVDFVDRSVIASAPSEAAPPPPVPSVLHPVVSLLVYKAQNPSPPEVFTVYRGAVYSLCGGYLYRYKSGLQSAGKILTQEDAGTSLQASGGVVYTRQPSTHLPQLLNIYPLKNELVLPMQRNPHYKCELALLDSFVVWAHCLVFCEASAYPNLVIISKDPSVSDQRVSVQFEQSTARPIYLAAASLGHVLLMCTEWVELRDQLDVLRLVKVEDGSTIWKHTLKRPVTLQKTPNPVTYHHGYVYLFESVLTLKVLDTASGGKYFC